MSDLVVTHNYGDIKSEWEIFPSGRIPGSNIYLTKRVRVKCSYMYLGYGEWKLSTIHTTTAIEFPYWPIRLFRRIFKRNTLPKAMVINEIPKQQK